MSSDDTKNENAMTAESAESSNLTTDNVDEPKDAIDNDGNKSIECLDLDHRTDADTHVPVKSLLDKVELEPEQCETVEEMQTVSGTEADNVETVEMKEVIDSEQNLDSKQVMAEANGMETIAENTQEVTVADEAQTEMNEANETETIADNTQEVTVADEAQTEMNEANEMETIAENTQEVTVADEAQTEMNEPNETETIAESTQELKVADDAQTEKNEAQAGAEDRQVVMENDPLVDPEDPEDMEDGELSDEEDTEKGPEVSPAASSTDVGTVEATSSLTTNSSNTDQTREAAAVPAKRSRKSTESSDEPEKAESGSSSSSEEDSKSERKRRKKEKERRKKEKRQKRKREKHEKKMKRKRQKIQEYDDGYQDYDSYGDRWRDGDARSPPHQRQKRGYGDYSSYGGDGRSSPGSKMYNSHQDPYGSPPDDSSEDEFAETLYSLVGEELMDPNVSAADKEALFKKQQERIPGLSAGKLKKIMKKRKFQEQQRQRQRDTQRRDRRDGGHSRDKSQKCRYYAEGKCQKGERCQFSHNFIPAKKMEACKFFLQGYCAKGDMCIYLHSEVPCKYYHTGQKCFNAEKCKFSHEPLTDSTKPLLEKAILLEETGTFKSERPSLLGSPPKESHTSSRNHGAGNDSSGVRSFDPDDDQKMKGDSMMDSDVHPSSHIPSIFSLDIQPTRDMQDKLDAGLFEELTAPESDSEEERFDSPPHRPKSFYSDTFGTPNRPETGSFTSDEQMLASPNRTKKNRWGPDLPNQPANDRFGGNDQDFNRGGGDADRGVAKKTPLLPIPNRPSPFNQQPAVTSQPQAVGDITPSTAQAAAANLSKILNALRSGAVQATTIRASETRAAPAVADPRMRSQDPRAIVQDPRAVTQDLRAVVQDPRAVTQDPRAVIQDPRAAPLPDPRSQPADAALVRPAGYEPQADTRTASHLTPTPLITPVHRPVPEINGKFVRPMDFRLIPVYVEMKTSYIPPGAEHSQEMLRDPRIKKRVMSIKQDTQPTLPSLPDITADLQRIQNARLQSTNVSVATPNRQTSRTSIDSLSDPRRNSLEGRHPSRGQGDQNSNTESVFENGSKARNTARTALSKVNPMGSSTSYTNYDDDDEDENNSLTIDMPEDDSKSANKPVEAACT